MPHMFAFLPCRFTLHGLFQKKYTVPYTALYPVAHLWFPGPVEDKVDKDTKYFPVLSLFCHFFVARQSHPSNLKRAARLSHPCETLPGCGWKCLCKHSGGQSLIWEPLSASEEEILSSTKSLDPLQCLSDLDSRVSLLTAGSLRAGLAGPTWGLFSSLPLTVTKGKGFQENTEAERSRQQLLPRPQGCLKEGSLSCLPPGHSACLFPSHQNSSWTDQQAKEDPRLLCMSLFSSKIFAWDLHEQKERKLIASVHWCSVEEKAENHKEVDVQWKRVGDPELSQRGQRW